MSDLFIETSKVRLAHFHEALRELSSGQDDKRLQEWTRRVDMNLQLYGYSLKDWRPVKTATLLNQWELIH